MLRVVALAVLTLVAGNVCWAKPNHAFSYCQQPRRIFLRPAGRAGATGARARVVGERMRAPRIARTNFHRIAETQAWRGFRRVRVFLSRAPIDARARSPTRSTRARRPVSEEKIPFRGRRRFRAAQARMRESAQTFFHRRRPSVGPSPTLDAFDGVRRRRARRCRRWRRRRGSTYMRGARDGRGAHCCSGCAGRFGRARTRRARGDGGRARMSRSCRNARGAAPGCARETLRESGGRARYTAAAKRRRGAGRRDARERGRHRRAAAAAIGAVADAGAVATRARPHRRGRRRRRRARARRRRGFFPSEIDAHAKTFARCVRPTDAGIGPWRDTEAGATRLALTRPSVARTGSSSFAADRWRRRRRFATQRRARARRRYADVNGARPNATSYSHSRERAAAREPARCPRSRPRRRHRRGAAQAAHGGKDRGAAAPSSESRGARQRDASPRLASPRLDSTRLDSARGAARRPRAVSTAAPVPVQASRSRRSAVGRRLRAADARPGAAALRANETGSESRFRVAVRSCAPRRGRGRCVGRGGRISGRRLRAVRRSRPATAAR